MLRAFQRKNLLAGGSRNHQRIDFAAANRVEGFFSLLKPLAQLIEFQASRRFQISLHLALAIARLMSTLGRSDKSPTRRFTGNGSSLIRVGAAMMSDWVARPGSW